MPIVEELPFFQSLWKINIPKIDARIKFDPVRLLGTFDFAIQMRRSRPVWPKLNAIASKGVLKSRAEKLGTPISLNALDREWKFLQHPILQKVDRIDRRAPGVKAKHAKTCTIINGCVLEAALDDLHRIHVSTVSSQRPAESSRIPGSRLRTS